MGFMSKVKNIFYDDIDDDEEITSVKIEPSKPTVSKEIMDEFNDEKPIRTVKEEVIENVKSDNTFTERDLFRSEKTFNFTEFDEEEKPRVNALDLDRQPSRVQERERVIEKPVETSKPKVFKPSPVISPIYGILDKDYVKEDITTKKKDDIIIGSDSTVRNYENVRRKAYGKKDAFEDTLVDTPKEVFNIKEDVEEVKIDRILKKDRLDEVTVGDLEEKEKEDIFDDTVSDDTLEHDLFNLIDSMYDDKEE